MNRGGRMSAEDSAGAEFWNGGMFAFMKAKQMCIRDSFHGGGRRSQENDFSGEESRSP